MPISNNKVVLHKWRKYDFFQFFKKICKKICICSKTLLLQNLTALSMSLSCSGEQKEQFEIPFEALVQLEFEISLKNHARSNFSKKIEKNVKIGGRDLKNQFLPNKKHFSLVHDGIRNFLGCRLKDLFLTSPPTTIPVYCKWSDNRTLHCS